MMLSSSPIFWINSIPNIFPKKDAIPCYFSVVFHIASPFVCYCYVFLLQPHEFLFTACARALRILNNHEVDVYTLWDVGHNSTYLTSLVLLIGMIHMLAPIMLPGLCRITSMMPFLLEPPAVSFSGWT